MLGFVFRENLLLFCLCLFAVSCGLSNGSGRERSAYKSDSQKPVYNGLGYANGDYQMKQMSVSKPLESKSHRGLQLSAWGIIAVLAGSLFMGTVLYYAVLFYPILCKKERKNKNQRMVDCCPTAPPATENLPALSTPV